MYSTIGIAIPNYNNAQYLEECIESIEYQTYKNTKILVVDDCSPDNSIEVLNKLSKRYNNLSFIVNNRNMGVSYTRDRAIRELDTEYITTIDSDDFYFHEKKLENELNLIKKFKEHDEDIVAYSNIISTDVNGTFQKRNISDHNLCNGNCFEKFITRSARIPTCSLFAKTLYTKIGGFDHKIGMYEDWDFEIRLSKIAEFYYTYEDGFAYRHHSHGLSSAKKEEHIKWLEYVFNKNTQNIRNQNVLRKELYKNINPNIFQRILRKITKAFTT